MSKADQDFVREFWKREGEGIQQEIARMLASERFGGEIEGLLIGPYWRPYYMEGQVMDGASAPLYKKKMKFRRQVPGLFTGYMIPVGFGPPGDGGDAFRWTKVQGHGWRIAYTFQWSCAWESEDLLKNPGSKPKVCFNCKADRRRRGAGDRLLVPCRVCGQRTCPHFTNLLAADGSGVCSSCSIKKRNPTG